jgi:hexosaminidase
MKKFICFLSLTLLLFSAIGQGEKPDISIIPIPVSMQQYPGFLDLKNNMVISYTGDSNVYKVALQLSKKIADASGYHISIEKNSVKALIYLELVSDSQTGNEGYKLSVTPQRVRITAYRPAGLFYGIQTVFQLLPKEIESKTIVRNIGWKIPSVEITDKPRFTWRGLMFDVCRHFFTVNEVKRYIDEMAAYKYNLLHLHLTEDEGWRLEIKSLPNLTKIGAWRVKREGKWGNTKGPLPGEPADYGGFYTQDDIRELVRYAGELFVNILPEIDMPGHNMAAIASYPDLLLSCTPGDYHVDAGEEFMEWPGGGAAPIASIANMLCPSNEKVYEFADKVFSEVATLFPFEYIHIGGDECAKNFWQKNDDVRALMEKEGLKTMEEVQAYFEKRIEKIIESKGKKVIGWDEILEGGLAPNASVMSWRGMNGGIAAAKLNHAVVMSPTDFTYLDFYQGEATVEPPVYRGLRLNKTYSFEPVPPGVDPKYILGGQANLWTEQLPNFRSVEYMMWPRGLAVAESVWSPAANKNWPDFVDRVEKTFERMDIAETKYARSMYDPIITASKTDNGLIQVKLDKEIDDLDIYYSFDETNPDNYYPRYTSPITVPKDAATLKIITYRKGKLAGKQINMTVEELKRRAAIKV